MRLDKFLKVSRIVKRRTVANEAADGGRIEVNGKVAKPSKQVQAGDIITVLFGNKKLSVKVLATPEVVKKEDAEKTYEVIIDE
ncbi:MAG: RNA-binding S4 domain-containing protein [Clostridia bacterium]|nr:RNA-binding S4 domain-containing protein [Clostridia bacterium]MBR2496145.1 RNA-binding S4 domain-containing protein [Clostridia bacterium]MBR6693257.1 RNA-binding S4 domain-containing protein [Clostridia bacterium]